MASVKSSTTSSGGGGGGDVPIEEPEECSICMGVINGDLEIGRLKCVSSLSEAVFFHIYLYSSSFILSFIS